MNVGVLGTGVVGKTIATKLRELGHEVLIGSRSAGDDAVPFADAAAHGELVFNCTAGTVSLEALGAAGDENLSGKVLVDVSNPLDFSKGMPPTLSVCNDDSVGEQIQRAFPEARVVKTLNTMNAAIMVDPGERSRRARRLRVRKRRRREGSGLGAPAELRLARGSDHRPRRHQRRARARRCTSRSGCA